MSRMQRDKGRKAEAEVRAIWERAGFEVRGLEASGDHLIIGHGLAIHSEVKRQEVLRLPLWTRQAIAEAPKGALPVLAYRRSREPWRALTPEPAFRRIVDQLGWRSGLHYSIRLLNEGWWAWLELEQLAEGFAAARSGTEAL